MTSITNTKPIESSFTFQNETQNRLVLDSLLWLGEGKK
jgi:hypothetical protein